MHNKKFFKTTILISILAVGGYIGYHFYSTSGKNKTVVQHAAPIKRRVISRRKVSYPEKIIGKVVTLKKLTLKHAYEYYSMFSPKVRKFLEFPKKVTFSYIEYHIREYVKTMKKNMLIAYTIWDNKDNKLVGSIKIQEKNQPDVTDYGQLSMWLNENYWGGGRIQEAMLLISRAYFKARPEAKDYVAHVREWNPRSQKAMEKFGFKKIGDHHKDDKLWSYRYKLLRSHPRLSPTSS
jgi:RimJ/RimL family protein N-acetyltransferase